MNQKHRLILFCWKKRWLVYFQTLSRPRTLNTWLEALQHFSNLVVIAKRIKKVIRIGKILDLNEKKGFTG
jgi:hypothetical protein